MTSTATRLRATDDLAAVFDVAADPRIDAILVRRPRLRALLREAGARLHALFGDVPRPALRVMGTAGGRVEPVVCVAAQGGHHAADEAVERFVRFTSWWHRRAGRAAHQRVVLVLDPPLAAANDNARAAPHAAWRAAADDAADGDVGAIAVRSRAR